MSKTIIIILIVIAIILIGGGAYYYLSQEEITPSAIIPSAITPSAGEEEEEGPIVPTEENKFALKEYMLEAYPDYLEGTISFSEETATLKTDGKVYILQPKDPKYYQEVGIKDGQTVAIQGKIVKDEYLTVGVIK